MNRDQYQFGIAAVNHAYKKHGSYHAAPTLRQLRRAEEKRLKKLKKAKGGEV